jgi:ligand-binding sensor domain-containing protein
MRGLYRFDKESKLFSHPAIRIGTDKWTSLYRDNSGILWLGKEADGDGLYKFDPSSNTVSRFPFDTHTRYKIYKDRITRIYEDSKENLWICTNRGLSKFDRLDNHFTHYFLSEKEVKNHSGEEYTRDVLEPNINSKRFLWVAADSGLYQFDTETGKFSILVLVNIIHTQKVSIDIFRLMVSREIRLTLLTLKVIMVRCFLEVHKVSLHFFLLA